MTGAEFSRVAITASSAIPNLLLPNGRVKDFPGQGKDFLGKAKERISRAEEKIGRAEDFLGLFFLSPGLGKHFSGLFFLSPGKAEDFSGKGNEKNWFETPKRKDAAGENS